MRTKLKLLGISLVAAALTVAQTQAQCRGHRHGVGCHGARCHGAGCWGFARQAGDPTPAEAMVTVTGEVARVERLEGTNSPSTGVHLHLKMKEGTLLVLLGPSWYLDNQEVRVHASDKIAVTGVRTTLDGQAAIIAAEVRKGDDVLTLRDENGFPRWAGWRRR